MRIILPSAPDRYDPGYISRALSTITQAFLQVVPRQEAVSSVLLQSPGGKVYSVTVDDSGTLSTTEVGLGQQGSPPY